MFTVLKMRGVQDVLIAVYHGLRGRAEAMNQTWEQTLVQQRIGHLIHTRLRYSGRQHRDAIVHALKPVSTAPSETAAKDRFEELAAKWGARYLAIIQPWHSLCAQSAPFLGYDALDPPSDLHDQPELSPSTHGYRRAVRARGHFPNEATALKRLHQLIRSLDTTGHVRAR